MSTTLSLTVLISRRLASTWATVAATMTVTAVQAPTIVVVAEVAAAAAREVTTVIATAAAVMTLAATRNGVTAGVTAAALAAIRVHLVAARTRARQSVATATVIVTGPTATGPTVTMTTVVTATGTVAVTGLTATASHAGERLTPRPPFPLGGRKSKSSYKPLYAVPQVACFAPSFFQVSCKLCSAFLNI